MKAQFSTQRLFLLFIISTTVVSCQEDQFFQKELALAGNTDVGKIPNAGGTVIDGGSTENDKEDEETIPTIPVIPTLPEIPTIPGVDDGGEVVVIPPILPPVVIPNDCGEIKHNDYNSRTRFQSNSVAFGQLCSSELQTAQCLDGTFSEWSGTFKYSSCAIQAPSNCGDVKHGETATRIMYSSASVVFGSSCQTQTQVRTCNNGAFSSWNGNYSYDTCIVESQKVKQVTESFTQNSSKQGKVDILWMVDNSGSMSDEQKALALNFDRFISTFLSEKIDFKMGITTTDIRSSYSGVSRCAFDKLTSSAAASNEYLFVSDFKKCIQVGTNGYSVEAGLTTSRDFLKRYSSNFLRNDAYLIVVMISDEPEQSRESVETLVNQIKAYKANTGLLKIYSIVPTNSRISERYLLASSLTGGKTGDITGNFSEILKEMGEKIVDLTSSFALKSIPYDDQIVVTVNGQVVTNGWTIDTQSGTLKFDELSTPSEGAIITIKYNAKIP